MQYLIFAPDEAGRTSLYEGQVDTADSQYLEILVFPTLKPLKDEEYINGIAAILHTVARSSYILCDKSVYWCIEWNPGLIVVKFAEHESFSWTAIRSRIPEFGNRTPLQIDLDLHDENEDDHQYNLIFGPWDAQFDEEARRKKFFMADQETNVIFQMATERANLLHRKALEEHSKNLKEWINECIDTIEKMAGEGLRL